MQTLQEKRSNKTADSSREGENSRGDGMLELVREVSYLDNLQKFNDQSDHDIQVDPSVIWEEINNFNGTIENKLKVDVISDKKHMLISTDDFIVKVKFFKLPDEDDRLRLRFCKKKGDIHSWSEV